MNTVETGSEHSRDHVGMGAELYSRLESFTKITSPHRLIVDRLWCSQTVSRLRPGTTGLHALTENRDAHLFYEHGREFLPRSAIAETSLIPQSHDWRKPKDWMSTSRLQPSDARRRAQTPGVELLGAASSVNTAEESRSKANLKDLSQ
ncbi:hypothetical protein SprV_0401663800 [Sparganum proliferum]